MGSTYGYVMFRNDVFILFSSWMLSIKNNEEGKDIHNVFNDIQGEGGLFKL